MMMMAGCERGVQHVGLRAQMVSKTPARMQGRIDVRERSRAYLQRTEKIPRVFSNAGKEVF